MFAFKRLRRTVALEVWFYCCFGVSYFCVVLVSYPWCVPVKKLDGRINQPN